MTGWSYQRNMAYREYYTDTGPGKRRMRLIAECSADKVLGSDDALDNSINLFVNIDDDVFAAKFELYLSTMCPLNLLGQEAGDLVLVKLEIGINRSGVDLVKARIFQVALSIVRRISCLVSQDNGLVCNDKLRIFRVEVLVGLFPEIRQSLGLNLSWRIGPQLVRHWVLQRLFWLRPWRRCSCGKNRPISKHLKPRDTLLEE